VSKLLNVEIIEAARALIANENHWCRRQMAFDLDGGAVCATDNSAFKWCGYGALIAAAHHMNNDCSRVHELAVNAASCFGGSSALIAVNDTNGHAAVLALFDEAMARM
jgi:hypothetical protein